MEPRWSDDTLREKRQKLCLNSCRHKFGVTQFYSGVGSLYDAARDLLFFNGKRIAGVDAPPITVAVTWEAMTA